MHLWTGSGQPPAAYTTYQLCRLFHCLPSELRAETIEDVWSLMACINAEAEAEKRKNEPGLDQRMRGTGGRPTA